MMQSDYPKAAAFTGHRFICYNDRQRLKLHLESEIAACYHSGIRYFLCGMAIGFDMLAAETLLAMKADYPDIQLTAVLPFVDNRASSTQRTKSVIVPFSARQTRWYALAKPTLMAVSSDATTICCVTPVISSPTTMASRKAARSTLAAGRSAWD